MRDCQAARPCKLYVGLRDFYPVSACNWHFNPSATPGGPQTWRSWLPARVSASRGACTPGGSLFELFSPIGEHRDRHRAGPFQGNIDQETLAVRSHVVEIPALGNGPRLEEQLGLAGFHAAVGAWVQRQAHDAAIVGHVEQFAAVGAPARQSATLGHHPVAPGAVVEPFEGLHVDFVAASLVRLVGEPFAVGRDGGESFGVDRIEDRRRAAIAHRQPPEVEVRARARQSVDEVSAVVRPIRGELLVGAFQQQDGGNTWTVLNFNGRSVSKILTVPSTAGSLTSTTLLVSSWDRCVFVPRIAGPPTPECYPTPSQAL